MAGTIVDGAVTWKGAIDNEGNRTYNITFLVEAAITDGPSNIMDTEGLPAQGDVWDFDDDYDPWAFCTGVATFDPLVSDGEPNRYWKCAFTFSTKITTQRCADFRVEDPLLEPAKISGTFVRANEEATYDRFGRPIINTSWEPIRGPQVEFQVSRPTVKIEMNVPLLNLDFLYAIRDTVNSDTIWGFLPRMVLLSNVTWERKYYGSCEVYYTVTLEFEINPKTYDRDLLDEGTKVLNGHWNATGNWVLDNIGGIPPDPGNPQHFIRFKDKNGENARVILDGFGSPAGVVIGTGFGFTNPPGNIHVEKYSETNFLLLGIPLVL